MEKFTKLTGTAAPMRMINVDTDMVIPKRFASYAVQRGVGISITRT